MADEALQRTRRQRGALSLTDRLRSGGLDPHAVALAAYLGHEEALRTGVAPWEPPRHGGVEAVLRHGELERRQLVWLACDLAERVVRRYWRGDPNVPQVIALSRAWCRSEVTQGDVRAQLYAVNATWFSSRGLHAAKAAEAAYAAARAAVSRRALVPAAAAEVAEVCQSAENVGAARRVFATTGGAADAVQRIGAGLLHDDGEHAWQARHLARVLLSWPERPDWRDTP